MTIEEEGKHHLSFCSCRACDSQLLHPTVSCLQGFRLHSLGLSMGIFSMRDCRLYIFENWFK